MGSVSEVKKSANNAILFVLASMALIVMFVEIMIVPALPMMARDFPDQISWLPWVLSIYMLVGAVATPLAGKLGDIYGKKKVLIAIMSIYLVALIGSGFSVDISKALLGEPNVFVLLFFRGLQGVGMGMFTLAFGIVRDTFPQDKIPVAIGMISAMFSVGVAIGLVVGGYITSVAKWSDAFHVPARADLPDTGILYRRRDRRLRQEGCHPEVLRSEDQEAHLVSGRGGLRHRPGRLQLYHPSAFRRNLQEG